jgi:hypothetical protein
LADRTPPAPPRIPWLKNTNGPHQFQLAGAVIVDRGTPLAASGKGVIIYKADLEYVRQLLASTEALLQDVQAVIAEARRLHEQARLLHDQQPTPTPPAPSR